MPDQACLRVRLFALAGMLQDIASADAMRAQLSDDLPFAAGLYRGSSNACALAATWIREELYAADQECEEGGDEGV